MSDVQLDPESVQIVLRCSKTDQTGKGPLIFLGSCVDPDLCPVAAVRQYLVVHGDRPRYLFVHQDCSPLTKFQFWSVTRRALDNLGLRGWQFGNSFRIGAASMGYGGRTFGIWADGDLVAIKVMFGIVSFELFPWWLWLIVS